MACKVSDNTVNPPSFPSGLPNPGFAPNPLNVPLEFPEIPYANLQEIYNLLSLSVPVGVLKPSLSQEYSKSILDGIISILEKFTPVLYAYSFLMPILNMLVCIVEVLCAIPNPFKLRRALRRLFRKCIPGLLKLYPSFAVIAMIISLLLLIKELIYYIIAKIDELISLIKQNLEKASLARKRNDAASYMAITKKIAQALCLMQNMFVILGVVSIIVDVINSLLKLSIKKPCGGSTSTQIDPDNCCTPDVCPSFIKNCDGMTSTSGSLYYYNKVSSVYTTSGASNVLRDNVIQFYDSTLSNEQSFINIINPYDLPDDQNVVFFPPVIYDKSANISSVPYSVDVKFLYNPILFGRTDPKGIRNIIITDCIVYKTPTANVISYNNSEIDPSNGVLSLLGGIAVEEDGTKFVLNGKSNIGIQDLLYLDPIVGLNSTPNLDDYKNILISNVSYTFHINYDALLQYALITLGCVPDVASDRDAINIGLGSLLDNNESALGSLNLPDVKKTQDCVNVALSKLRGNVSIESIADFQAQTSACLLGLNNDIDAALLQTIDIGFDPYNSSFTIDPTLQFTTKYIQVAVTLNDFNKIPITKNISPLLAVDIAKNIKANISLGTISDFFYDGQRDFIANITSDVGGEGSIEVSYNNNMISVMTNPSDISQNVTITPLSLKYTFISTSALTSELIRRDETDVSENVGD